jgi:hypothetical protein
MPRTRSALEAAAGQLILAIDQEWRAEAGTPAADLSEAVVDLAHELLQASKRGSIHTALNGMAVADFLGPSWVGQHPATQPAIHALEALLASGQHA